MDDEHCVGLELEELHRGLDRTARVVHERLRLQQRDLVPVDPHLREPAVELRAPGAVVAPRELVDDEPADVVPVSRVLAAGVAEPRDEQVVRGAVATRPQPHGVVYSSDRRRSRTRPQARPRPSAPRPRRPRPRHPPRPRRPLRARARPRASERDGREDGLAGSSSSVTPSGSATVREAERVAEVASSETSASRCSGTSIGSASTFSSFVTCERTPPSFTPADSPCRWSGTVAWIGWSRRTSCRSTCVISAAHWSCWYSLSTEECAFPPSTTTSSTAFRPPFAVSAERRSRSGIEIETGSSRP